MNDSPAHRQASLVLFTSHHRPVFFHRAFVSEESEQNWASAALCTEPLCGLHGTEELPPLNGSSAKLGECSADTPGNSAPGQSRLGPARPGSALLGPAQPGSTRLGTARLGSARPCSAQLSPARLGLARLGPARPSSARLDSAWHGSARHGSVRLDSAWHASARVGSAGWRGSGACRRRRGII